MGSVLVLCGLVVCMPSCPLSLLVIIAHRHVRRVPCLLAPRAAAVHNQGHKRDGCERAK